MIKIEDIDLIALSRPDAAAIVEHHRSITWRSLAQDVRTLMAVLERTIDTSAVKQVAIFSENSIELVKLLSALSSLRIPTCGVDYGLAIDRTAQALDTIGADVIFYSPKTVALDHIRQAAQATPRTIIDLDDLVERLDFQAAGEAQEWEVRRTDPDTVPRQAFRAIAFTSGTSGAPKASLRSKSTDARRFHYFTTRYELNSGDRYLLTMPLFHVAGNGWARHFLSIGASLHLVNIEKSAEIAQAIVTQGITAMTTTPIILSRFLDVYLGQSEVTAHRLRFVVIGGKNFSPALKHRALQALGPVVFEYYGSTETGVNAFAEPADLQAFPESVGRPYAGQKIMALDEQRRVLPVGQSGRIAIASFLLMDSYVDGSVNEVSIDGVRYMLSPDHGFIDEDGRLYVLNRSAGDIDNFDSYKVEESLRNLAGVADVALIVRGVPEGTTARVADCALTLRSDAAPPESLLAQARAVLGGAGLQPETVAVLPSIPYNLSGKIRWTEVEDRLKSARQRDRVLAA